MLDVCVQFDCFVDINSGIEFCCVVIMGFIDLMGSNMYNFVLLVLCVCNVMNYLCSNGLKVQLFVFEGFGVVDLVVFNVIVEGCVQNCCVEIWIDVK